MSEMFTEAYIKIVRISVPTVAEHAKTGRPVRCSVQIWAFAKHPAGGVEGSFRGQMRDNSLPLTGQL